MPLPAKNIKKVLLVGDYGHDDLAFKEVTQRLYELAGKKQSLTVDIVSVDAFNTAQTAAVVAQAAKDGKYDIIYHNTAPRKDTAKPRGDNDGEGLAYANYHADGKNVHIIGVSSDVGGVNTFALLPRDRLHDGVHMVDCPTNGSQFRSRDIFTPSVNDVIVKGTTKLRGAELSIETPEETTVADARRFAERALADAVPANQLSQHGDASQSYITIIGHRENAQALITHAAKQFTGAEVDMLPLKSKKDSWLEAGFAAAQLALNSEHGSRRTVAVFTKKDSDFSNTTRLYRAKLDNGARIITDDLQALVFAQDRIVHKGIGDIVTGYIVTPDEIAKAIKPIESLRVAYKDGYGNLKLVASQADVLAKIDAGTVGAGRRGVVSAAGHNAYIADGSFSVKDGELALSKGSSGWIKKIGRSGKEHFAELFKRGGSASQLLGWLEAGDAVDVKWVGLESSPPGTIVSGAMIEKGQAAGDFAMIMFARTHSTSASYTAHLQRGKGSADGRIQLVRANDHTRHRAYYFMLVNPLRLPHLQKAIANNQPFDLEDFGDIIVSGYGDQIPESLRIRMKMEFGWNG